MGWTTEEEEEEEEEADYIIIISYRGYEPLQILYAERRHDNEIEI